MRYLVTTKTSEPFLTHWVDAENHFNPEIGMVVYDLNKFIYTTDGVNWNEIIEDHL